MSEKIIEDYFRALGWKYHEWDSPEGFYQIWENPNGKDVDIGRGEELPSIIYHFPSFKTWVLEKMLGEGYYLDIDCTHGCVEWVIDPFGGNNFMEHIVDNEITLAAVQAATRYWREKK